MFAASFALGLATAFGGLIVCVVWAAVYNDSHKQRLIQSGFVLTPIGGTSPTPGERPPATR